MLTPDYLAALPDTLVALYAQAEQDILADMARRVSTYDYWIPAADYQYRKLIEMGAVHDNVLAELSKRTGRTSAELAQLMDKAGQKAVASDGAIYEAHGLSPPPLLATPELKKVLESGLKQTDGLFQNLTATTAHTAAKQFENALDRAWMQIATGAFDHNAAVRTAIKDLARQGIGAITYPSGHVDSIEVAVRRAVVTGVNQTALKLQDALADEMGSDLVEVTAHGGARPDHAAWQGGVYSRSGQSKKYKSLRDATGYGTGAGLGGWNCRHSFFPYFEGSPRTYTPEMLKRFEAKEYTYAGQPMTESEATGQQRYIERQIRRWKRENAAMDAAGLDTNESAAKIKQWQDTQKDFIKQTGLKRQGDREQIDGYGHAAASKVAAQAKRVEKTANSLYNTVRQDAIEQISSGQLPKTLNIGNQNKHIRGANGFTEGRSYLYGSAEDAQAIVARYSGIGELKLTRKGEWTHKEFAVADKPIGVFVDQVTGEEAETNRFSIHYGKKGTHIVPARRDVINDTL